MRPCLIHVCKPSTPVRIACLAALTLLVSSWSTCSAIVNFSSCPGAVPLPQITSLSPDAISGNAGSVLLTVNGSGFAPQSQILWNGSALPTTVVDSRRLETTITQQTFDSFGGLPGDSVLVSVMSAGATPIEGCPNGGASATLVLLIN